MKRKWYLLFWGRIICLTIIAYKPFKDILHLSGLCWSLCLWNFFCTNPLIQTSVFVFRTEKCRTKDLKGGAFSIRPVTRLIRWRKSTRVTQNKFCFKKMRLKMWLTQGLKWQLYNLVRKDFYLQSRGRSWHSTPVKNNL